MVFSELATVLTQAGSFISAVAAITAGVIMVSVTRKFGTGILASGFRSISIGVFFIAIAIIIDAVQTYFVNSNLPHASAIVLIKELLFVLGTYTIVIGSKNTGDKIEKLTK